MKKKMKKAIWISGLVLASLLLAIIIHARQPTTYFMNSNSHADTNNPVNSNSSVDSANSIPSDSDSSNPPIIISVTSDDSATASSSGSSSSGSSSGSSSHHSSGSSSSGSSGSGTSSKYPLHEDISVTFFWIGEGANGQNGFISNKASAWDSDWREHYGGTDDPDNRNGYFPAGFTPEENPFYFALPYNDFDGHGERKENAENIYWFSEDYTEEQSLCKNRWIKITKGTLTAYAQWEDVGPFNEDDISYVFGGSNPENTRNNNAGLDVSPAVHDYLNLEDIDVVDWQFVDFSDVPDGPWKQIITTSQVFWG